MIRPYLASLILMSLTLVTGPRLQGIAAGSPASSLSAEERAELSRYASDTWRSMERLTLSSGLPADRLTKVEAGWGEPAYQTSPSNIGAYLWSVLAAERLGLITTVEARSRLKKTLETVAGMERLHGFYLNDLDPRDGRAIRLTPPVGGRWRPHISSVDNGWLAASLRMISNTHPELRDWTSPILDEMDFRFFYIPYDHTDPVAQPGLLRVGYHPEEREFFGHYGMLNSEARILSYLGIGRGQLPPEHYYRLYRTLPEAVGPQAQSPQGRLRRYAGVSVFEGSYEVNGARIVPSWGGSMFEALMVTLFVPEDVWAPQSWGVNHPRYVQAQIRHGLEEMKYGFWGFSPAASPSGGYGNYGVKALGTNPTGYFSYELGGPLPGRQTRKASNRFHHGVVTPHASFLALRYAPHEALSNLRKLQAQFPIYGQGGFFDSVDVSAGVVRGTILALDQGMILAAIANALADDAMQRAFSDAQMEKVIRPLISVEEFNLGPERLVLDR